MGIREDVARQYLELQLSRRQILKAGIAAPAVAGLAAACGVTASPSPSPTASAAASAAASPSAPPSPTAENYQGVTLQVWSGGTTGPPAKKAAEEWSALTGGQVNVTVVPFGERAIKFAGLITAQDSSIDALYASGDFVGRFNDRLYENLSDPQYALDTGDFVPATLQILTAKGGLRALPQHSEMEIYIYNKEFFQAAGLNADTPPDTWDGLYAAADKLHVGNRYGCAVPWTIGYGGGAYYLCFLNSIPDAKPLSEDRTQLLFNDDKGLQAFKTIEAGLKAKFFDPNIDSTVDDYGTGKLFNGGNTASEINFAELWGQATSGNAKDFGTTIKADVVGTSIMPGIQTGNSGSINGFEGFGLNKFGKQKQAALSYLKYMSGPKYQKELNLSKVLPSSRTSVLSDPDVTASYPVGKTLAAMGAHNLDRYAAPYDWTPPFSDAMVKLYKGQITADEAHKIAVDGVEKIIEKYLSS